MSLYINYGSRVLTLPYEATMGRMNGSSAEQLRVLIYICANDAFRSDPEHNIARAISDLHMSRDDIEAAVKYWRDAKVVLDDAPKVEFIPEKKKSSGKLLMASSPDNKSSGETAEVIDTDPVLKKLIDELGQIFGKMLLSNEIFCLVSMYNYLHLPTDYILELGRYCAEIDKRSVAYMSRMATSLFDQDVVTKDTLVVYLKDMREKDAVTFKIKKLFGIGTRALIAKEKKFIAQWLDEYKLSYEMIELAYELTVQAINEPSMDYCNGIIKKWVSAGINTPEQVHEAQEQYKASSQQKNGGNTSFDVDEFMKLALDRSYKE